MKEREKCKTTSHHRPQCAKWFSRHSISKSGIWAIWTSPFCRFLTSFSIKYDVTDACCKILKKWKCNTSSVFCLICLKFSKLLEVNKWVSLDFKFRCYGNSNENNQPLFKNKRLLFSHNKKSVSPIFLQNWILPPVAIKLYCSKLHFEHYFCLNNRPFVF